MKTKRFRRGIQFARIFHLSEVLRSTPTGLDIRQLTQGAISASGYRWHSRTIRRDLLILEELRLVYFVSGGRGAGKSGSIAGKYVWNFHRQNIFEAITADSVAEATTEAIQKGASNGSFSRITSRPSVQGNHVDSLT